MGVKGVSLLDETCIPRADRLDFVCRIIHLNHAKQLQQLTLLLRSDRQAAVTVRGWDSQYGRGETAFSSLSYFKGHTLKGKVTEENKSEGLANNKNKINQEFWRPRGLANLTKIIVFLIIHFSVTN